MINKQTTLRVYANDNTAFANGSALSVARRLAFAGLAVFLISTAACAGPLDDAKSAYQHQDYQAALAALMPLAKAGDPEAQYIAGYMYAHGQGTSADAAKSLDWYRAAADHGYSEAQFALGLAYEDGRGVPQDYQQASKWYDLAAQQNLARAQNNLGNLYNNGFGLQQSYVMAYMWYALAKQGGDDRAQRNLKLVELVISPADVAAAKRLARDWRTVHPRKPAQP